MSYSTSPHVKNEVMKLYLQLEFPKFHHLISKMFASSIHSKWFIPVAFVILYIWKKSTAGKYFLLDNRFWFKKSYLPKELAPFYPQTGDLPISELKGSLKTLTAHVRKHFDIKHRKSYKTIRYWLSQNCIPPIIVLEPPLPRTPYSKKAKGFILDGNHRAIAMALKGELIRSYVGVLCSDEKLIKPKNSPVHKIEYAQKYFNSSQARVYEHGLLSFRDQFITSLEVNLIKKIAKAFLQLSKNTYLDIATGSGRMISQLEYCFDESLGLDSSKNMLTFARSKTKVTSFLRADSENLPFTTNSFSIVTCFRLFINLSKTGRKKFLLGCKRILNEQGILVVDNHCNKISPTGLLGSLRFRLSNNINVAFKLYSLMFPFQFDSELRSAGFVPVARLYTFFPSISHLPFISKSLKIAIDSCLSGLPVIRSFADLIVLVARKR